MHSRILSTMHISLFFRKREGGRRMLETSCSVRIYLSTSMCSLSTAISVIHQHWDTLVCVYAKKRTNCEIKDAQIRIVSLSIWDCVLIMSWHVYCMHYNALLRSKGSLCAFFGIFLVKRRTIYEICCTNSRLICQYFTSRKQVAKTITVLVHKQRLFTFSL